MHGSSSSRPASDTRDLSADDAARVEAPNAGEADALAVLWEEQDTDAPRPLQLNEIYRRICDRRRAHGESEPALTTVSTHLRSLVRKKLAQEVQITSKAVLLKKAPPRGNMTPPTRSPLTAYVAAVKEEDAFKSTMHGIVSMHRPSKQLESILTYARVAGASQEVMDGIRMLIEGAEVSLEKTERPMAGAGELLGEMAA